MIDRKVFFARIRKSLFSGRIGPRQVEGVNTILNTWFKTGSTDLRQLAYILATAYHETAWTFQPIKERGGLTYLTNNYDITGNRPKLARANGNITVGDGARYAGRGFVQLTWRNNYRSVGKKLGIDLEGKPHLALEINVAALILVKGMQEGWFTGRRLSQYFSADKEDWVNARRIVNGLDKARSIAAQGKLFLAAMVLGDAPPQVEMLVADKKPVKTARTNKTKVASRIKPRPLNAALSPESFQMPSMDGR
jgi:putative chitinase